jgi:hypothetical protein
MSKISLWTKAAKVAIMKTGVLGNIKNRDNTMARFDNYKS